LWGSWVGQRRKWAKKEVHSGRDKGTVKPNGKREDVSATPDKGEPENGGAMPLRLRPRFRKDPRAKVLQLEKKKDSLVPSLNPAHGGG